MSCLALQGSFPSATNCRIMSSLISFSKISGRGLETTGGRQSYPMFTHGWLATTSIVALSSLSAVSIALIKDVHSGDIPKQSGITKFPAIKSSIFFTTFCSKRHGIPPVTITYKITPKLHTSTEVPQYCCCKTTSGGQ